MTLDFLNQGGSRTGRALRVKISRRTAVTIVVVLSAQWLIILTVLVPVSSREVNFGHSTLTPLVGVSHPSSKRRNGAPAWGGLRYQPITISAPPEFVEMIDPQQYSTDWFFPEMSRAELGVLLRDFGLSENVQEQLLDRSEIDPDAHRRRIGITNALISEIPIEVRARLYAYLAEDALNLAQSCAFGFASDSFDEWFKGAAIRPKLRQRVRHHVYRQGSYLRFADLRLVLPEVRNAEELAALFKVLTRVKTLMVTLEVVPDSSVPTLLRYWGCRGRNSQVRTLLESLSLNPSGGSIDVAHLLPPFARRRLYTYPNSSVDPLTLGKDCHWTAHNFFNPAPDDRLAKDLEELPNLLATDYYEVYGDLRLGDVLMFVDEGGEAFHSAVYIANDIVFTKNGPDYLRPWYFCRLNEMMDFYPRREPVRILYYRQKKS